MVTGQRRSVLGEVVDEGRCPQLRGNELFEDILDDLAVDCIIINLNTDLVGVLEQLFTRRIHRDLFTQSL